MCWNNLDDALNQAAKKFANDNVCVETTTSLSNAFRQMGFANDNVCVETKHKLANCKTKKCVC